MRRVVTMGMGITGRAVADALIARDVEVVAFDDNMTEQLIAWSQSSGVTVTVPTTAALKAAVAAADALLPAPGLPDHHEVFELARAVGTPTRSELDLAQMWDDRPMIAVTGTDGKTTVVTLIERMLNRAGIAAAAVGNTDVPVVSAIEDSSWETFVVEASSFRLGHSATFAPAVAAWINFGPDHLDAHATLEDYEAAKASLWHRSTSPGVRVANRDDPTVMRHASPDTPGLQTFGADARGDHGLVGDTLIVGGEALVARSELQRNLPHDIANILAAAACALAAGADRDSVASIAREFIGLPHRAELIADHGGVRWINDSKATTPHATEAALGAMESVILIAGGRNKGLDLSGLSALATRVRHLIAIGEAGDVMIDAFGVDVDSTTAGSMAEAVATAHAISQRGDTVLLSPACASYDWYLNYRARGDDFTACVKNLTPQGTTQ